MAYAAAYGAWDQADCLALPDVRPKREEIEAVRTPTCEGKAHAQS